MKKSVESLGDNEQTRNGCLELVDEEILSKDETQRKVRGLLLPEDSEFYLEQYWAKQRPAKVRLLQNLWSHAGGPKVKVCGCGSCGPTGVRVTLFLLKPVGPHCSFTLIT